MQTTDIGIIVIIAISALMSIKRGFVREVLSLVIWLLAITLAIALHKQVAPALESHIALPSLRNIAAMIIVFVLTLIAGSLLGFALGSLIKATGLTSTDRFLGVMFGALRGVLVVALLVMFSKTFFSNDPWWQSSSFIPYFEMLETWLVKAGTWLYEFIKEFVLGITLENSETGAN